ncbi:hypothetical protein ARMA_1710 [Ardenticatena maritima]|uniref:Uncharacterized protein n=1 Tax=Ardenticatena maritima TaxID=872965 RepID=A0A0M9UCT5_9CHLR|nr:hypothetical protein ARMA_1710 [Ardenticatena maritima]
MGELHRAGQIVGGQTTVKKRAAHHTASVERSAQSNKALS